MLNKIDKEIRCVLLKNAKLKLKLKLPLQNNFRPYENESLAFFKFLKNLTSAFKKVRFPQILHRRSVGVV